MTFNYLSFNTAAAKFANFKSRLLPQKSFRSVRKGLVPEGALLARLDGSLRSAKVAFIVNVVS